MATKDQSIADSDISKWFENYRNNTVYNKGVKYHKEQSTDIAYSLFQLRMEKNLFEEKINKLDEQQVEAKKAKKWNFLRACYLFNKSAPIEQIDRNISTLLLFSSIEAISSCNDNQLKFQDFLVKNPQLIAELKKEKVKEALENAFTEYIKLEDIEPVMINLVSFLDKHCPDILKKEKVISEFERFLDSDERKEVILPFKDVMKILYKRFRNDFVHGGILRLGKVYEVEEDGKQRVKYFDIYIRNPNNPYVITLDYGWLKEVVVESLLNYLIGETNQ